MKAYFGEIPTRSLSLPAHQFVMIADQARHGHPEAETQAFSIRALTGVFRCITVNAVDEYRRRIAP
jgi:hypothetical protein